MPAVGPLHPEPRYDSPPSSLVRPIGAVAEPPAVVVQGVALAALVVFAHLQLHERLAGPWLSLVAEQTAAVPQGHAVFRAWQNRLLGPWLVEAIASVTHMDQAGACYMFIQSCLIIADVLCLLFVRRIAGSTVGGLIGLVAFAGGELCLSISASQPNPMLTWDYIDLLTMLVFAYAIVVDAPVAVLVVLYAVEALNRESALFVALWLVLAAFPYRRRAPVRWGQAALGGALLAVGAAWTQVVRRRLYAGSLYSAIGADPAHREFAQQWHLRDNWHALVARSWTEQTILALGYLGVFIAVLAHVSRRLPQAKAWALVALGGAMMVAILVVGAASELRVYSSTVPLVVILAAACWRAPVRGYTGHSST